MRGPSGKLEGGVGEGQYINDLCLDE